MKKFFSVLLSVMILTVMLTTVVANADGHTLSLIAMRGSVRTEYVLGDVFVAPAVIAIYSDGSTEVVAATFSGYDMNVEGEQTVTVTYQDKTTSYKIFIYGCVIPPYVELVDVYDYNYGLTDKVVIEARVDVKRKIMVGDDELYYNDERDLYVGIVDEACVYDSIISNVSILDEAPTTFVYGKLNGNILSGSVLRFKLYIMDKMTFDNRELILSDVNADGRVNNADLLQLKLYMQKNREFSALDK